MLGREFINIEAAPIGISKGMDTDLVFIAVGIGFRISYS